MNFRGTTKGGRHEGVVAFGGSVAPDSCSKIDLEFANIPHRAIQTIFQTFPNLVVMRRRCHRRFPHAAHPVGAHFVLHFFDDNETDRSLSSAILSCDKSPARGRKALGNSGTVAGIVAGPSPGAVAMGARVSTAPCSFVAVLMCALRFSSHSSIVWEGFIGTALRILSTRSSSEA